MKQDWKAKASFRSYQEHSGHAFYVPYDLILLSTGPAEGAEK